MDAAKYKYIETQQKKGIEDFKKGCMQQIDQLGNSINIIEKFATDNFGNLSKTYLKGYADMKAQTLKGDAALIEQFKSSFKQIQDGINEAYSQLTGSNINTFSSNFAKFMENIGPLLAKISVLKESSIPRTTTELGKYLEQKKKETLDGAAKLHNDVSKVLKDNFDDTLKKLTISPNDLEPKKAASAKK